MLYDPNVNNMLRVYVGDKPTQYGAYASWYQQEGEENRLYHLYETLRNEYGAVGWPRVEGNIVRYYNNDPGAT